MRLLDILAAMQMQIYKDTIQMLSIIAQYGYKILLALIKAIYITFLIVSEASWPSALNYAIQCCLITVSYIRLMLMSLL